MLRILVLVLCGVFFGENFKLLAYCRCNLLLCLLSRVIAIHSFIQAISIAPLLVRYYSEAPQTQHGYYAGVSRRNATGNCE